MPGSHSNLLYHVVFSTKNRLPLITPVVRPQLYSYIGGVLRRQQSVLIDIGGVADHIHVLAKLPPTLSIAAAVKAIKGASSRWLNEQFTETFRWQSGYAASTVSESVLPKVSRYIQAQEHHHRDWSFEDEMSEMVKHCGASASEIGSDPGHRE